MRTFKNKCKITDEDVTTELPASELVAQGYRKISNAYCHIARIDRDDWLEVLAAYRRCSVADFYNIDGSGVGNQHRDHYCRCYSKDVLTVHPCQIHLIPTW